MKISFGELTTNIMAIFTGHGYRLQNRTCLPNAEQLLVVCQTNPNWSSYQIIHGGTEQAERRSFFNTDITLHISKHLCVFHRKRYNVYWCFQTITNSSLRISCIRLVLSIKKQACSSRWIFNLCAWTDCTEHCRQSAALFQRKYSGDLLLPNALLESQQGVHPSDWKQQQMALFLSLQHSRWPLGSAVIWLQIQLDKWGRQYSLWCR